MTCFDMYVTEHNLPVRGCPVDYGYSEKRPANCYSISCFKDCWARECIKSDCEKKAREKE